MEQRLIDQKKKYENNIIERKKQKINHELNLLKDPEINSKSEQIVA